MLSFIYQRLRHGNGLIPNPITGRRTVIYIFCALASACLIVCLTKWVDGTDGHDNNLEYRRLKWANSVNSANREVRSYAAGVKFDSMNSSTLSRPDQSSSWNSYLNYISNGGPSYRLSAKITSDLPIQDVWFEVTKYPTSSQSRYLPYYALQGEDSHANWYYADIPELQVGTYAWRARVKMRSYRWRSISNVSPINLIDVIDDEATHHGSSLPSDFAGSPFVAPSSRQSKGPTSRPTSGPTSSEAESTKREDDVVGTETRASTTPQPNPAPVKKATLSPISKSTPGPSQNPTPIYVPTHQPDLAANEMQNYDVANVKFDTMKSTSVSCPDHSSSCTTYLNVTSNGGPPYRLSAEITSDKPIQGIWFEVRIYPSASQSPYLSYSALQEEGSDSNWYYADIPDLQVGTYTWRASVKVPSSWWRSTYHYSSIYLLDVTDDESKHRTSNRTDVPTHKPTPTSKQANAPKHGPSPDPTPKTTEAPSDKPTPTPTSETTEAPAHSQNSDPNRKSTEALTQIPSLEPAPTPTETPTRNPLSGPAQMTISAPIKGMQYGLQDDCNQVDSNKFNICLDLRSESGEYMKWMDAFEVARDRWEQVITDGNYPPIDLRGKFVDPGVEFELPTMVDDIYVSGSVLPVDGPGGILGMGGPRNIQKYNLHYRPRAGVMKFDSADIGRYSDTVWQSVILHELGHVLGVASMMQWKTLNIIDNSFSSDQYVGGPNAQAEWQKLCPGGQLPLETDGGAGTAGAHWDDACLSGELMTGYISPNAMQLSSITIASLMDIGYSVNMSAADPFTRDDLGKCGAFCPDRPDPKRNLRDSSTNLERHGTKVSEEGHQLILRAAAKELQRHRLETSVHLRDNDEQQPMAQESLTVYILDIDGLVKEESVTYDDVKDFIPGGNVFDN